MIVSSHKKVGIVIPFYDGDQYILRCIDSINTSYHSETNVSIYIIDNNEKRSDITNNIKSKPNVNYIQTKPKIGYGRACNIGAFEAINDGCEYLIFLNQDTYMYKGSTDKLIEVLSREDNFTIVSPMIFEYDNDRLHQMYIESFVSKNQDYFTDTYLGKIKDTYKLPHIGAACIGMHRDIIEKLGLFDPVFYMYSEDIDLMDRVNKNNGQILLATKSKVAHVEAVGQSSDSSVMNYYLALVKYEIRTNQPRLFRGLIYKSRQLRALKGFRFALKYLANGFKLLLNTKMYKAPNITELKERITIQIAEDKL